MFVLIGDDFGASRICVDHVRGRLLVVLGSDGGASGECERGKNGDEDSFHAWNLTLRPAMFAIVAQMRLWPEPLVRVRATA